jgi:molybdate transport system substrate-binding protein
MHLDILSAGAAKAVVISACADLGVIPGGAFGAVGAMQDKLLAGEPCDVIVLTRPMIDALAESGKAVAESVADLGRVRTGVAVKKGTPRPNVSRAETLASALMGAEAIYVPDLKKSTAGKHIASVFAELGIASEVADRIREFPNGAAAMRAMADAPGIYSIGCTQVSEILYTEGAELVGALPDEFELSTLYSSAVCTGAADRTVARNFVLFLTGESTRRMRRKAGFEA